MWTGGSFFYLYGGSWYGQADLWTVESLPTSTTRLPVPTCHIIRSFVCKHFNPNWLWVVFQFRNILVNKQHHTPPWKFLSFLYTLYWQDSRNNSEVAMELSIFVSRIATVWGWWKSRKPNKLNYFSFNTIDVFSPPIKLFLLVPNEEDPVFFFLLLGDQIYFDFLSLTDHHQKKKKKESEKLKNSHFGQIKVQFIFCKVSYWDSVMKVHPLWKHISQLSHWTNCLVIFQNITAA